MEANELVMERSVRAQDEKEKEVETGTKVQLIVFKLGDEEYALPIDQVKEIVLTPRISEVPQTPEYVLGIANIRGNIISIMDFEKRFGLTSKIQAAVQTMSYTMVIESADYQVGIRVSEVPKTLSVWSSKIDNSSNIMQFASLDESTIRGVVKLGDRMIILLDFLRLMELGEVKTKL